MIDEPLAAVHEGHAPDLHGDLLIGYVYPRAIRLARDAPRAVASFTKAAGYGDGATASNRGFLYQTRNGVRADAAAAAGTYERAARKGSAEAANELATLHSDGSPGKPTVDSHAVG